LPVRSATTLGVSVRKGVLPAESATPAFTSSAALAAKTTLPGRLRRSGTHAGAAARPWSREVVRRSSVARVPPRGPWAVAGEVEIWNVQPDRLRGALKDQRARHAGAGAALLQERQHGQRERRRLASARCSAALSSTPRKSASARTARSFNRCLLTCGLEAQRDAIARFAETERCDVADTFTEVETGKGADALDRRPQLAAALKVARRLKCPIVVSKLDRLSRDT
jgi:hypothetical protein